MYTVYQLNFKHNMNVRVAFYLSNRVHTTPIALALNITDCMIVGVQSIIEWGEW